MPIAAVVSPPQRRAARSRASRAAVVLILTMISACSTGGTPRPSVSPDPSSGASPGSVVEATAESVSSLDTSAAVCAQVGAVGERAAALRAVELRLPNRVALDIELGKLQAAYAELAQTDLGALESRLEGPLTRLGYRLGEVELAVEDFRTNSRPQRAVEHVETDAQTFDEELSAFAILARCG